MSKLKPHPKKIFAWGGVTVMHVSQGVGSVSLAPSYISLGMRVSPNITLNIPGMRVTHW